MENYAVTRVLEKQQYLHDQLKRKTDEIDAATPSYQQKKEGLSSVRQSMISVQNKVEEDLKSFFLKQTSFGKVLFEALLASLILTFFVLIFAWLYGEYGLNFFTVLIPIAIGGGIAFNQESGGLENFFTKIVMIVIGVVSLIALSYTLNFVFFVLGFESYALKFILVSVLLMFAFFYIRKRSENNKASLSAKEVLKDCFFVLDYCYQYNPNENHPNSCFQSPSLFSNENELLDRFLRLNDNKSINGMTVLDCVRLHNGQSNTLFLFDPLSQGIEWFDEFSDDVKNIVFSSLVNQKDKINNIVGEYVGIAKSHHDYLVLKRDALRIEQQINKTQAALDKWKVVSLPDTVLKDIIAKLELFENNDPAAPRGLLFYGPPGTGKTFLARTIADVADAQFISLSLPDLKSPNIGQSGQNVRSLWIEARKYQRTIIFVDECEGVFGKRGSLESDIMTNEIVLAFLAEWGDGLTTHNSSVWVVGATNRRDLLDPAIISRFGAEVEIPLPDREQRKAILLSEMKKMNLNAPLPEFVVENTSGMSGRDIGQFIRNMVSLSRNPDESMFKEMLAKSKSKGSTVVDENANWDSLVLEDGTKNKLIDLSAMLQNYEKLRQQKISLPKGIMFFGPPGTGKTQIARTFANESKMAFIAASTADLKAGYIGQSGQKVKELFERARTSSPSILFLDEIDVIAPVRGGVGADQFTSEIVAQLLQEMDGIKSHSSSVFVIAATNNLSSIDSAILSRFNEKVEIPLPDDLSRRKILEIMLKDREFIGDKDSLLDQIAQNTLGLSGRDLKAITDAALNKAVMRSIKTNGGSEVVLTNDDFN